MNLSTPSLSRATAARHSSNERMSVYSCPIWSAAYPRSTLLHGCFFRAPGVTNGERSPRSPGAAVLG